LCFNSKFLILSLGVLFPPASSRETLAEMVRNR
jgi:hypothetical protein